MVDSSPKKPDIGASTPDKNLYGFDKSAEDLVKALFDVTNKDESLVIGIEGEWGSGKSTYLKCIKEALNDKTAEENSKQTISKKKRILTIVVGLSKLLLFICFICFTIELVPWLKIYDFFRTHPWYYTATLVASIIVFSPLLLQVLIYVRQWLTSFDDYINDLWKKCNKKDKQSRYYLIEVTSWLYKGKENLIELLFGRWCLNIVML